MGSKIMCFLFVLLLLLVSATSVSGARVYGTIYDSDLNAVSAVVVEVNSTPVQRHVSKYGGYSFDLRPGIYEMIATLTINGTSKEIAREYVQVADDDGDYIVDLFIFPDIDLTKDFSSPKMSLESYLLLGSSFLAVLAVIILTLLYFKRKPKKQIISTQTSQAESSLVQYNLQIDSSAQDMSETALNKTKSSEVIVSSDDDLQLKKRILSLIETNGGQMTQKEIRRSIDLSEAKISQVISDLTTEKKVKKVKQGRSNVIVVL